MIAVWHFMSVWIYNWNVICKLSITPGKEEEREWSLQDVSVNDKNTE